MARAPTSELLDTIADLRDEIRVLRDSLDEMRVLFEWAVNNDKVRCPARDKPLAATTRPETEAHSVERISQQVDRSRFDLDTILCGDCIAGMKSMPDECVDLVFADPPFNIGYEYDQYEDRLAPEAYIEWTRAWTSEAIRLLKPTGSMWVAIGDEFAAEVKMILHEQRLTCRNWVIWYYTFGVNCQTKFSRSHTHLFYMVKDSSNFTFNDGDLRVPSARQLDGDDRAHPDGRIPDDTWILRPKDVPGAFHPDEDTWHVRRVNGTFRERQGWHACQMPEQVLARILRTCSKQADTILDPFIGSGTTAAVAKKLGRHFLGFELSEDYAVNAQQRVDAVEEGQPIEGSDQPFVRTPARRSTRRPDERQQGLW